MTSPAAMRLRDADRQCAQLVRHYENFTVASRLAPRRLRRDLTRVYGYARTTDDIGDESGDARVATDRLLAWREQVVALFAGRPVTHPVLVALAPTVRAHQLPEQPFLDLIDANLQDQTTAQYEDWPALLGYCRLSAAPVGRIVLQLFGVREERAQALSDDVCIGLQLANFAQDVSIDSARRRTYLLQADLRARGEVSAVASMCERARALLESGRELEAMVRGRLRFQLALYRLGGEAILDAVAKMGFRTAKTRPVVSRAARLGILVRAMRAVGARVTPEGRIPPVELRGDRREGALRRQDPGFAAESRTGRHA
ncbi:MAG TPA: squalene/phytoene synthase family protein [Candidatus Acidoferrales bacterium]|nr:squalene/phytoene synthase family protein [Candidatus Acidoferrales bacterium]